jgi:ABC-type branched-subunit amino acid transport system ATPase component/branched-subunit amino acid ABC-type transport system permease component
MEEILKFAALGLGTGALYALGAQGMVLIYRGSGVINFAHGAMALLAAAVFADLRSRWHMPVALALPLAVACSGFAGFLVDYGIMRRIRDASPLARVVVTLGVLGIIESIVVASYGSGLRFVDSFLPDHPVDLGGIQLSADRLLLCLIAMVVTGVLWALYRYTEFGRQTTAVAENPRSAAAIGISPNIISHTNWALGAALAGLTGVLLVPLTGLMAATMVLLINPLLAAALVGRFSSFPLTLLGGFLIGIAQSLINYADAGPGWSASIPFLVIVVMLVFRGQSLPLRGYIADKLPRVMSSARPGPVAAGVVLLLVALIFVLSEDYVAALTASMLASIVLLSIVTLTGLAGQVSLGQYALAGVGAFVAARLADVYGWSFFLGFPVAIAVAVPVGLVFAVPALRSRGINLAIVTLGLGLALDALVFKNKDFTGGFAGTRVSPPQLFGFSFDSILYPQRYAMLVLVILVLCALLVSNLRRSASGRRLLAVRSNERAAAAQGISVVRAKLYAFAVAAGLAAAGGAVAAFRYPIVRFDVGYSAFDSIPAVLMVFLGGIGFVLGAAIGGLLSLGGMVNELLSSVIELNEWQGFAIGVGAVAMVMMHPDGMATLFSRRPARREPQPAGPGAAPAVERCIPERLEIEQLSVRYGGVQALNEVSFRVEPGQVVGLIGPNGAGKTTLLDAISGFTQSSHGSIHLAGTDLVGLGATARARLGLGRSFQSLELFDDLTVEEHLRCACEQRHNSRPLADLCRARRDPLPAAAQQVVTAFEFEALLQRQPGELSFGQRRLLGIARAVAAQPSILLLDEPAAGLDSTETMELGQLISSLARDWGMGILLIEHDVHLVMTHCDQVVVLDFGNKLASGTADEISSNPAVIGAYLGAGSNEAAGHE